jgi:hypothetical protein
MVEPSLPVFFMSENYDGTLLCFAVPLPTVSNLLNFLFFNLVRVSA